MTLLDCALFLATLPFGAYQNRLAEEEGQGVLLVQVTARTIRPTRLSSHTNLPSKAEEQEALRVVGQWLAKVKDSLQRVVPGLPANDLQPAFLERLLSCVNFFRAGAAKETLGPQNSEQLLTNSGVVESSTKSHTRSFVLIVACVIGLVCVACIFCEYDQAAELDYRGYQHYARDKSSQKTAKSPLVQQGSAGRIPSQRTSPIFHNRDQVPLTFKKVEQHNAPTPFLSASRLMQDPSGVATQARQPALASTRQPAPTQLERHAPATRTIPSSLSRQTSPHGQLLTLCSELVMHVRQSFKVHFDHLDRASGSVPILAEPFGKVLLFAHINDNAEHNQCSVSLSLAESSSVLGAIKSEGSGILKLTDGRNEAYGELQYVGKLHYKLFTGGKEAATLKYQRGGNSTGNVHLTATSGASLAEVVKHVDDGAKEGEVPQYLEVKVEKGVDSVLALLCIFGAMILG